MTSHRIVWLGLAMSAVGASVASGSASSARGVREARVSLSAPMGRDTVPVYSDSQATAGQAVYGKRCAECHETKDVTGADFKAKWKGQTVFALFEQIRTTMPDDNPGTLTREEYASTVAYILKLNGLPAGAAALPTDSAALSAITLDLPSSSQY